MNLHDFVFAQKDLTNGGSSPTQVHLFIFVDKLNMVEPRYSEPLKCGHLVYRTFYSGTDCISINSHTPEMRTPRYSVKRTSSSVPLVPGLYIILWIMWTLTCLSTKCVRHHRLIQQLDIIIALVRIVQASGQPFSQTYSKGEL